MWPFCAIVACAMWSCKLCRVSKSRALTLRWFHILLLASYCCLHHTAACIILLLSWMFVVLLLLHYAVDAHACQWRMFFMPSLHVKVVSCPSAISFWTGHIQSLCLLYMSWYFIDAVHIECMQWLSSHYKYYTWLVSKILVWLQCIWEVSSVGSSLWSAWSLLLLLYGLQIGHM